MLYAAESLSLHSLDDLFAACLSGVIKEPRVNLCSTYLQWE